MNYEYCMPTKVIFGRDCIAKNSAIFKTFGKKALIVTGARSAKENGSEKEVTAALDSVGIDWLVFDKVMSNPTIPCVYEGAAAARKNGADFVIAIGGGSPMDAGKAIALLAAQDIAPEDLFSGKYQNKILPMVFVPTTAGTGSEVTQYSILTNDSVQSKTSIASPLLFPSVAFMDAKYMEHLSVRTTVNTAVDALSHLTEGMLSVRASLLSDTLAAQGIGLFISCLPELLHALQTGSASTLSPAARERLLQSSLLGGMVIAQTGTTVVHAMGYSLTYFRNIDHGRANGLLLGAYLGLVEERKPELAQKVLQAAGYPESRPFCEMLALLMGEKEQITAEEIGRYAKAAVASKNMGNCMVRPSEEEVLKMFQSSLL